MPDLTTITHWIENGKQIGTQIFSNESEQNFLIGVAVQKYKNMYKVCHYKIDERDLYSEDEKNENIEVFETIDNAIIFLKKIAGMYCLNIEDFRPFKGSKMFNPEFD